MKAIKLVNLTQELKEVLLEIRCSLSPITLLMKECIDDGLNMDLDDMDDLGSRLILLAEHFTGPLKELRHTILIFTLMDAGLSVKRRVKELKTRNILMDDTVFFAEIYSVVKFIEDTISSGEYYDELVKIYRKRLSEDLHTRT